MRSEHYCSIVALHIDLSIIRCDLYRYKDDVQLHEDERHTFYADEDGFFAMTIDPVQVINIYFVLGKKLA